MTVVFAVVGLILGGAIAELAGAIGGAALGYAIGLQLAFKRRLDVFEDDLQRIARERRAADNLQRPAAPPVTSYEPAEAEAEAEAAPELPADEAPASSDHPRYEEREWPSPAQSAPPSVDSPRIPTPLDPVVAWVRDYFTGGNLVVRTGIIVLFFGVAFLLKFAADHSLLPIELRLAGAALGGAALLIIGWRLRIRQRAYALALQGGGVGLLYLTTFAALRLYDLLPPTLAFTLMVVVAALSAFLAIGQNAMALVALGATGGFLAPVLASTGQGNHVVLFSFYALLDAGIVAIAWFKAWRALNLLAFVFTYAIGTTWGVLRYAPENFSSTEPFLLLFFAMFVTVAVLFALRRAPDLKDYVDGTLVFGTPVMTMLLQSALVRRSALRHGVQRTRSGRDIPGAGRGHLATAPRAIAAARRCDAGAGGGVPHTGSTVGARWSLDRGHLGARRRGNPVDRIAPATQAGDRLRHIAAVGCGDFVRPAPRCRPGRAARWSTANFSARCSSPSPPWSPRGSCSGIVNACRRMALGRDTAYLLGAVVVVRGRSRRDPSSCACRRAVSGAAGLLDPDRSRLRGAGTLERLA